jgi:external thioesterase TEII
MTLASRMQLFILHFAGGNSYSFQFLKPYLPRDFDVISLELPGRGKRINETLISTEPEAVEDLVCQITSHRNDLPYVIFGHSMGASLGLSVTKKLEESGDPPRRLIVAGNAGPGTGNDKLRSTMSDEELKEELSKLGGSSDEVLDNDELFSFFTPILKSDFKVLEDAEKRRISFKIKSSIIAVMGDKEETSEKIENWKNFTSSDFKSYLLPGNHFFIYDHPFDLTRIIKNSYDGRVVS